MDVKVAEFFHIEKAIAVDVRSPEEFQEGTITGAINIPLFENEERKEIGTIYKQIGKDEAKWRAMELVSPKIPSLLSKVKALIDAGHVPVLFCWRGGNRSKAFATFLEFAGIFGYRIEGGYRAYREHIVAKIPNMIPDTTVVLHGMTGGGKTDILARLQKKGYPVVDLEEMAGHKGSIFGAMGQNNSGHNQKTFDALLFSRLLELAGSPFVIVEAESKRIGKITQPEELLIKKKGGIHFYVEASLETRVARIYHEYVEPFYQEAWFYEQVQEKFSLISKRIKDMEIKKAVEEALRKQNYHEFIRLLLEHYYDPRYGHKQHEYAGLFLTINSDSLDDAVGSISENIDKVFARCN